MNPQHLSDEAIAAFADGVLHGHARERAARHADACAECRLAVRSQREAVWALRAAPAPSLPGGLFERLCALPATTSLPAVCTTPQAPAVAAGPPDHAVRRNLDPAAALRPSALAPMAAFVPARPAHRGSQKVKPFATGAAVLVLAAGALAAGAAARTDPTPEHGDGVVMVRVGGGEQLPVTSELVNARFSRR